MTAPVLSFETHGLRRVRNRSLASRFQQFYKAATDQYVRAFEFSDEKFVQASIYADVTRSHFDDKRTSRLFVLDVGCGHGTVTRAWLTEHLSRRDRFAFDLLGVDPVPSASEQYTAHLADLSNVLRVRRADADIHRAADRCQNACYDILLCDHCLYIEADLTA